MADVPDDSWLFGDGGFAKLYGDRLSESSILECPVSTRWIFIWMLAQANSTGRFKCPDIASLARSARTKLSEARRAVSILEQPDPSSQTPDNEGRRIKKIHGGWQVLNYEFYRDFRTNRQVQEAERKQDYRDRKRDMSQDVPGTSSPDVRRQTSDVRSPSTTTSGTPTFPQGDDLNLNAPAAVWWDASPPSNGELAFTPDFAVALEQTWPTVPRAKIREELIKFSMMLADPKKANRLERLIRLGSLEDWVKGRIREDLAQWLAQPENADERMTDQASDRRRREKDRE